MSTPRTVWTLATLAAAATAFVLLVFLPFSFWVDFALAAVAFFIIAGLGHRYFLRNATPEEIRADLEARKNSPG